MYKYKPILSDEEMSKIELPQAEFIHNSAIKVLEEIKEAINNLHKKADEFIYIILFFRDNQKQCIIHHIIH